MRTSSLRLQIAFALVFVAVVLQAAQAQSKGEFDKSIAWSSYEVDCDAEQNGERCIVAKMRTAGASDAAVRFAELLIKREDPGWAVEFDELGSIDLVMAYHPFRANTNESLMLVNGSPAIIPVDFYELTAKDKARPDVQKMLRRNPEAFLIGRPSFVRVETLSGRSRYVFGDTFAECRACEPIGSAEFGFEFDASGIYRGTSFIRAVAGVPATK